jgi:hypothetical protein
MMGVGSNSMVVQLSAAKIKNFLSFHLPAKVSEKKITRFFHWQHVRKCHQILRDGEPYFKNSFDGRLIPAWKCSSCACWFHLSGGHPSVRRIQNGVDNYRKYTFLFHLQNIWTYRIQSFDRSSCLQMLYLELLFQAN